jgi:small subunit ribosomal protein S2
MAPYIFMERNGIHIIDLNKTLIKLDEAKKALKQIAKSGRKILFVATKKQAKEIVAEAAGSVNMPYVTERWPGGMLTNFPTIRKAIKKMNQIDKLMESPAFKNLSKRERLQIQRQRAKLEKNLGSIADLSRLPSALFIVDINKEHIALKEAIRLNIPVFAIVDTNTDPTKVDFPIPGNDDASESIAILVNEAVEAIKEGLEERRLERGTTSPLGNFMWHSFNALLTVLESTSILFASSFASAASFNALSLPGIMGTPACFIVSLARTLSPIALIIFGLGPINV